MLLSLLQLQIRMVVLGCQPVIKFNLIGVLQVLHHNLNVTDGNMPNPTITLLGVTITIIMAKVKQIVLVIIGQ